MPKLTILMSLSILIIASGIESCNVPLNADIIRAEKISAAPSNPPSTLEQSIHQQIN